LLHRLSGRTGPFVDVPAGELDPALAADQLFGHVRGAFTGARDGRTGRLAAARDGTVLLDDFHLFRA
jgi:DNA-binding NtrC family response regulator